MSDNAFYRDNNSLWNQSVAMNCKAVECLDNYYNNLNKEELKNTDNDRISDLEKKLEDYLQKFVQVENNLLNIQSENLKIKKRLEEIKSFPLDIINQSDSIKYEVYY